MYNSNESNATWFRMDGPLKRTVVTPVPVRLFTTNHHRLFQNTSIPEESTKKSRLKEWMHRLYTRRENNNCIFYNP